MWAVKAPRPNTPGRSPENAALRDSSNVPPNRDPTQVESSNRHQVSGSVGPVLGPADGTV